jgi:UDP-N-acetyl-D-glucosamine dehydrogenase
LIDLASEINSEMPTYTVEKIGKKLNESSKAFKGATVLILGIAYKKNIDDLRESPALEIIQILQERGSNVIFHDPLCDVINDDGQTKIKHLPLRSVSLTIENIRKADIAVILTDHTDIDYKVVVENASQILDTRGVLNKFI